MASSLLDPGVGLQYPNVMCTVVTLVRPGHDWPLILAANRDEMRDRPARPPGRHWDDRGHVTAGLDLVAGGTWLGMNDDGLVACVLNRVDSLGPVAGKRSRGELPLDALDHAEARTAARALAGIDPMAYGPFNMVIADINEAWWVSGSDATGQVRATPMAPGVSMVTAHDMNDRTSDRIRHHLPRFRSAPAPRPQTGDWFSWQTLMADRNHADDADWRGAMLVSRPDFGTVSSSLIALSGVPHIPPGTGQRPPPVWRFAAGPPDEAPYVDVML